MLNSIGYSVYISTFEQQRELLEAHAGSGAPVFLSLHIGEEFGPDYRQRAETLCRFLRDRGYRTIADVSQKTLTQFETTSLPDLADKLGLWALRLDYGFSEQETLALAQRFPILLNASTIDFTEADRIKSAGGTVLAMHNFYPRPETGLDGAFLLQSTRQLQALDIQVLAFLPGDTLRRGPLFEGLPTLEEHRFLPPLAAFADLAVHYGVDHSFVGDPGLSAQQQAWIDSYCQTAVLPVPAVLPERYAPLYGRVFTARADSPDRLVRFQESREYSCFGGAVAPECCTARSRGCITLDNSRYGRYSGEIQLMRRDFHADGRVNVIGQLAPGYLGLADCIPNGAKFQLVPQN